MNTLAVAYSVAWAAVAAYMGWLGVQHHRLRQRLEQVESQVESSRRETRARAA